MTDSTKKMSEEWKNLDPKKKKKYEDLAAKDKERYETDKANAPPTTKAGKAAGRHPCMGSEDLLEVSAKSLILLAGQLTDPVRPHAEHVPPRDNKTLHCNRF